MQNENVIELTPAIIRRVSHAERTMSVVSVPHEETDGRALLVFMNPEQAETFRRETGTYPASEGFEVGAVDREGLEAICAAFGFEYVAVRGPEQDVTSYLDAGELTALLQSVSPVEVT